MKTLINIKADKEVKEKAQKIAKDLGVPLSTIMNAYLKEFVRSKKVSFSIEQRLRPEVEKLLKEASEDCKKGKNIAGPFKTAKEMDKYLNS